QPAPRRPRLPEALRRLQGRRRAPGIANRHPGQDHQGMDARPRLRGPQRNPPDQEDEQGGAADLPRPPLPPGPDPDDALDTDMPPYYRPEEDSEEYQYMMEPRRALDGSLPRPVVPAKP